MRIAYKYDIVIFYSQIRDKNILCFVVIDVFKNVI